MASSFRLILWLGALAGWHPHPAAPPDTAPRERHGAAAPDDAKKPGGAPGAKPPAPPAPSEPAPPGAKPPAKPSPNPAPPKDSKPPEEQPKDKNALTCKLLTEEQPRGGRLDVQGSGFGQTPIVRIADKATRILTRTADTISVQIARDSDGGPVTVEASGIRAPCGWLTIVGKDR